MNWESYMNDMVYGIPGTGFIADEDPNPPRVKVFVGFNNGSEGSSFIDKIGYWRSHHCPPDRCSFSSSSYFYIFDKSGELTGNCINHHTSQHENIFIGSNEASRLISAARDLGIVHQTLAKPLERIIRSIEKAAKK